MDTQQEQSPSPGQSVLAGPIGQFAAKTAIVVVAAFIVLWAAFAALQGFVDVATQRAIAEVAATVDAHVAPHIGGSEFWTALDRGLANAADPKNDLSAAEKQKIITEIRVISNRWRPFAQQIIAAAVGTPPPAPKVPASPPTAAASPPPPTAAPTPEAAPAPPDSTAAP